MYTFTVTSIEKIRKLHLNTLLYITHTILPQLPNLGLCAQDKRENECIFTLARSDILRCLTLEISIILGIAGVFLKFSMVVYVNYSSNILHLLRRLRSG